MVENLSPAEYSNALAQIDIDNICFQEICAKLHVENETEGEITVNVKNEVDLQVDQDNKQLVAVDKYEVTGVVKTRVVFEINLRILTAFRTKVEPTPNFMKLFQDNTLKLITYPYVRNEVQDLISKMGLPPFIMPIWRVSSKTKKQRRRSISSKN